MIPSAAMPSPRTQEVPRYTVQGNKQQVENGQRNKVTRRVASSSRALGSERDVDIRATDNLLGLDMVALGVAEYSRTPEIMLRPIRG